MVARTRALYEVPLVSPEIVSLDSSAAAVAVVTSALVSAFAMLISYPVTALPPSSTTPSSTALPSVAMTSDHVTVTLPFPAVALGAAIWSGVVDGVTDSDAADGSLSPTLDPAVIVHVVATPLVRLVTVIGELVPVLLTDPHVAVYWPTVAPLLAPAENVTAI